MRSNHQLHSESAADRQAAIGADAAKSHFLALMSHELRTSLNGILGMAHAELRLTADPARRERLGVLVTSAEGLNTILNDTLDLTAVEEGRLPIRPHRMIPTEVIDATVALFQPVAEAAGARLAVDIHPDLGRAARIDAQRLRQCLSNLLSNAIRHGGPGEVRLSAFPMVNVANEPMLGVVVSDDGPGISPEVKHRLFRARDLRLEPPGTTAPSLGHGLGLSIARGLARQMGGDLELLSQPGANGGARFMLKVAMPDIVIQGSVPAEASPAVAVSGLPLRGLRVLVVDDIATNRLVAVTFLRQLGAAGLEVVGGQEALCHVAENEVDLVLLDVNMPGLDGVATLARLRSLPAPAGRIPVIALTADALDAQRRHYLASGFDGYLAKPFTPDAILAEVTAVLSRRMRASA